MRLCAFSSEKQSSRDGNNMLPRIPPFVKFLIVLAFLMSIFVLPAAAQDETGVELHLSRDFGYSSGTGRIQGTFSMIASGPPDLIKAVFYIDDQPIGEDNQAPFRIQFSTDSYPLGPHTLKAIGITSAGQEISSNEIRNEFVSAEESWQSGLRLALPILGVVLLVTIVSLLGPTLMLRGKKSYLPPGTPRNYGFSGGTICPKCSRPFSMHLFGVNMVVGKLDRCPYCGRWSLVRRRPLTELREAEEAEIILLSNEVSLPGETEEEKLRKDLDDSRYQDM